MLSKFETKSNRVKGLCFHPTRPWILASLHNGLIQLWNYRMQTKLDEFDEHDGPVRGIDFHREEPMFVSGGDDYTIKVWNYTLRRCLFTLNGHLDYIRTVSFHHEYPWIVSASDDQTIRIWNWQLRSSMSVLTGHNHYVMCAAFHPKDDLVVSASLDQTVRVWDTSGLRKKSGYESTSVVSRMNADIFGNSDAVVKYVLEGHDRGVNWASFHPTLPLIVSGADDNQVKLWRMNDAKAWEMDTMRGHTNNVSCAIFHQKQEQDLIVSNSEDRTIRVWDVSKRMCVQTYRREHDRFWIVCSHPERNLLAVGHDSGLMVFKLHRERPAFSFHRKRLFYVKDRYLRMHTIASAEEVPVASMSRRAHASAASWHNLPRRLESNALNPTEHAVLVMSDVDGGMYELFCFPKDIGNQPAESLESKRGLCAAAVFVARNKFAVLDKASRYIWIRDFNNDVKKKIPPPHPNVDSLFFGGVAGRLILRSDEKLWLYEHSSRRTLNELHAPRVRRISWSKNLEYIAVLSKNGVIIANRDLEYQCATTEMVRVKSGAWDDCGVFVYTTLNHVKYILPNGDCGIIRSLDDVVYIARVQKGVVYCLDRNMKVLTIPIDSTEYSFKLALHRRRFGEVIRVIKKSTVGGQAIISYLRQKGFPEVALHFVEDEKTKFELALECGNIEVGMKSAHLLDNDECWHRLGVEALRQGNHMVVEMAYQRTKNFERLSFLYLITGNTDKLRKMLKIAEMRKDQMSRFHNALYLGSVEDRVAVLADSGQTGLGYVLAATHGLTERAAELKEALEAQNLPVPELPENASLLMPPTPILREENWPLIDIPRAKIDMDATTGGIAGENFDAGDDSGSDAGWGGDDLELSDEEKPKGDDSDDDLSDGPGWGGEDSLDISVESGEESETGAVKSDFDCPSAVPKKASYWVRNSNLAVDHIAAGSFSSAMDLLQKQIGVRNFKPLQPYFMSAFSAAQCSIPGLPSTNGISSELLRNAKDKPVKSKDSLPVSPFTLSDMVKKLKSAYKCFQKGKFNDALTGFRSIVCSIPFVVVLGKSEAREIKELLGICREYITAIVLETERRKIKSKTPKKREVELSAYLTNCRLQPGHLCIVLDVAMVCAFKSKNYITAAGFAYRLLELKEGSQSSATKKANKVLTASEKKGTNSYDIAFDEKTPFDLACDTFAPIYRGQPLVRCSYCGAAYTPDFAGKDCGICLMGEVGAKVLGLRNSKFNFS